MAQKIPESVHSVGETSVRDDLLICYKLRSSRFISVLSIHRQLEKDPFSFIWVVNNFSSLSKLPEVKSPVFHGGHKNIYGWQLTMNPAKKFDGVEYCSFYLSLVDYGKEQHCQLKPEPVRATFQISMLNIDRRPVIETEDASREFNDSRRVWGCQKFVTCSSLVNSAGRLVVNDTIKIHCKVVVVGVKQKRRRTDLTILTGDATFQAHTLILKARSSVFAAMFNTNMIENETNTLVISDFDDVVVKGMLEYLYTGTTYCMAERAPELLQIAEKYNLEGLKENCEYAMAESLSHENAGMFLVLAHTHNAPHLKQRTVGFINWNKEKLLKTKAFQDAMENYSDSGAFADLHLSQVANGMSNGLKTIWGAISSTFPFNYFI